MSRRDVAILVFDQVELLDFTGPLEVFAVTDELHQRNAFNVFTVSIQPGTVRARHGVKFVPDFTLEHCPSPHVLIVPGGAGIRPLLAMPSLLEWLRHRARTAEMVLSVCTGSLLLARAGLLDGLRATTHHRCFDELRANGPRVHVVENERFTDNGQILTSAGISAGLDCALHAVGRLLSPEATEATARYMEYSRR